MITGTMTSKGQLTVPKEIRDALKLQAGQQVEFRITPDGQATMRPRNRDIRSLLGMIKPPPGVHVTIEQMNETIADGWAGIGASKK